MFSLLALAFCATGMYSNRRDLLLVSEAASGWVGFAGAKAEGGVEARALLSGRAGWFCHFFGFTIFVCVGGKIRKKRGRKNGKA